MATQKTPTASYIAAMLVLGQLGNTHGKEFTAGALNTRISDKKWLKVCEIIDRLINKTRSRCVSEVEKFLHPSEPKKLNPERIEALKQSRIKKRAEKQAKAS
jgi:hypothetical protein